MYSSWLTVARFLPGKDNSSFSQQAFHFRNRYDAYQDVQYTFHMDVPLRFGILSCTKMQGFGTRIFGIQLFYPTVNLFFQVVQCIPVLEQAVFEFQDILLEFTAFPVYRRIGLYIMYKVLTIMILTVYSISSPHKSRSLGAVLI